MRGVPLKESSERLNRLSEIKESLQFTDVDSPIEMGTSASLTNTPIPHPLRQVQAHITSDSSSNPQSSNAECNQTEYSLSNSLSPKVKGEIQEAAVDSKLICDLQNPRIRIPPSEYVVPSTVSSTCSSKEVNLSSFPPSLQQDGQYEGDRKIDEPANFGVRVEPTIKPSTVLELERQLTPKVARQQTSSAGKKSL